MAFTSYASKPRKTIRQIEASMRATMNQKSIRKSRTKRMHFSLPDVKSWVKKAMTELVTDDYARVKYVIPNGVDVPPNIQEWFTEVGITVIDDLQIPFP